MLHILVRILRAFSQDIYNILLLDFSSFESLECFKYVLIPCLDKLEAEASALSPTSEDSLACFALVVIVADMRGRERSAQGVLSGERTSTIDESATMDLAWQMLQQRNSMDISSDTTISSDNLTRRAR